MSLGEAVNDEVMPSVNCIALKKLKDMKENRVGYISFVNNLKEISKAIKKGYITKDAYSEISDNCLDILSTVYSKDRTDDVVVRFSSEIIRNMALKDKSFNAKATEAFVKILAMQPNKISIGAMKAFNNVSKDIKSVFKNDVKSFDINQAAKIAVATDKLEKSQVVYDDWYLQRSKARINNAAKKVGRKYAKKYLMK